MVHNCLFSSTEAMLKYKLLYSVNLELFKGIKQIVDFGRYHFCKSTICIMLKGEMQSFKLMPISTNITRRPSERKHRCQRA